MKLSTLAAALLLGVDMALPQMGQRRTPTFTERGVLYNGDGRKMRPSVHPIHGAKRRTKAWRDYADKVRSTQTLDASGNRQADPRDDKYLHSHARAMRGFVAAIDRRNAA